MTNRQRTVYPPEMVCHIWANKGQDHARNAADNLRFNGAMLQSYGQHYTIAMHMDDGRVLWNDNSYSSTTNRHKMHARRALSNGQWQTAVHVPAMTYDDARDLQRKRQSPDGKTLPKLAQDCAAAVIAAVSSMATLRYGYGPIRQAWATAKRYEASGQALCEYVAKGKKAPKWPVPALPDAMPAQSELPAMIRAVSKHAMLADYAGLLNIAEQNLARLESDTQSNGMGYWVQNYAGLLNSTNYKLAAADKMHKTAMGRASAALNRAYKRAAVLAPIVERVTREWHETQSRVTAASLARDAYKEMRDSRNANPLQKRSLSYMGYIRSKLADAVSGLPESEAKSYAGLLARIRRVDDWRVCEKHMQTARLNMESAASYADKFHSDAAREYRRAMSCFAEMQIRSAEFTAYHAPAIAAMRETATAELVRLEKLIAEKHARAVSDWQAGIINSLPHEAGTFARIKGDTVQTSRGASVPIAHACRLARIARRVIAHGGKAWPNGDGPRVGHFTVQSIASDGAAIIGCHEFSAAESLRLLDLLESCAACAEQEESAAA